MVKYVLTQSQNVQEILTSMVTNYKSGNPENHITPAHPSPLIT